MYNATVPSVLRPSRPPAQPHSSPLQAAVKPFHANVILEDQGLLVAQADSTTGADTVAFSEMNQGYWLRLNTGHLHNLAAFVSSSSGVVVCR
jgi:hypothetical protein